MAGHNHTEKVATQTAATFKAAVVQAAPVVFDRKRTLEKVDALADKAAREGAQLLVFPEAFVSAYPRGLDFGAVVGARSDEGREDHRDRMIEQRKRQKTRGVTDEHSEELASATKVIGTASEPAAAPEGTADDRP